MHSPFANGLKDYFRWKAIDFCINEIVHLSMSMRHKNTEDAMDRGFIADYIVSCIPFLPHNPKILEFDGSVTYGERIVEEIGGTCYFATKKDRIERFHKISYEFDLSKDGPLPEREFDVIVATQVIQYFSDAIDVLKKLKLMLKDSAMSTGGVLICTTSGPCYHYSPGIISFFSLKGLQQAAGQVFDGKIMNAASYGDYQDAIYMMHYIKRNPHKQKKIDCAYQFEVINGILCKA